MKLSKTGLLFIVIGVFLLLSAYNVFYLNIARDWPWILVIIGLMLLIRSGSRKKTRVCTSGHSHERVEILKKLKTGEMSIDEAAEKLTGEKEEI